MPGLSAKVFRTYNASYTFTQELKKTPENADQAEKLLAYNRANRQVAILCNHQRGTTKQVGTAANQAKPKSALDKMIDKVMIMPKSLFFTQNYIYFMLRGRKDVLSQTFLIYFFLLRL